MAKTKILIVDDEKEILDLIERKLLAQGYQVFKATRGREAVQKAIENNPQLVLVDIVLPDIDGAEVVSLLQANPATQEIPVLFLSGIVTKEEGAPSEVKVGQRMYPAIAKPFTEQELLTEIRNIIP